MRIRDYVTGRVVAWAIISLLGAAFGIGRSHAHTTSPVCSLDLECDQGQAYTLASSQSVAQDHCDSLYPTTPTTAVSLTYYETSFRTVGQSFGCNRNSDGVVMIGVSQKHNYYFRVCDAPSVFEPATNTCFSSQECLERNAELGAAAGEARPSLTTSRCVAGCKFGITGQPETTVVSGLTIYRGVMEYTGDSCAVSPTMPEGTEADQKEIPPQECVPVAGQSMCVKPDGQKCASASSGKQFCWGNGETGEKTDGPDLQKRDPGETPQTPSPPESGDTLEQQGEPIVTTTTTSDGRTIVTTTTNYTTQSGTNAGTSDQGEPSDGTGQPDGEGDEDGDSATGGECGAGWTCSGDPIACAQLREANMLRCRTETDREELLADHQANGDGETYTKEDAWLPATEGTALDTSGFGWGSSCPALPVIGEGNWTIDLNDPEFCQWVFWLAGLFQLVALVWGLHIVGS